MEPNRNGRILIAANRLPVTTSLHNGVVQVKPSSGGLASGLRPLIRNTASVWFGWNGMAAGGEGIGCSDSGDLVEIPLTADEVERFYQRFANSLLWPVLHDWPMDGPVGDEDWATHVRVNERYADALLDRLAADDLIWIHDFHLLLLPNLIRIRAPSVPIVFFLHTPFPRPSSFLALPHAQVLMEGLLGADTVGFHTDGYLRNFLEVARMLGFTVDDDRVLSATHATRVKSWPMGIDAGEFTRIARSVRVTNEVERLKSSAAPMLMLGIDRLDYTKGIPNRLLAFEHLLQTHRDLHGRVALLQVAVPTRGEISAYRDLRQVVERLIDRINNQFATGGWLPVDCLFDSVDRETLIALYRAANVMLVTPQRDGLNLVAKEFVASRVDRRGVLLLSKFAGVANELKEAIQVDPNRLLQLSAAMYSALHMSVAEQRRRMREMRRIVRKNTVFRWADEFLTLPFHSQPSTV